MRSLRLKSTLILAMLLCGTFFSACCSEPVQQPTGTYVFKPPSPDELAVLRELAKGNSDKTGMALLADFKSLTPDVADFNSWMNTTQKQLGDQLKQWADEHQIDLTYQFPPGLVGKGEKADEDSEGSMLLNDDPHQFQRDYLAMMLFDFDRQQQFISQALANTDDPELKSYLESAAKITSEAHDRLRKLLDQYHWAGAQ
ncbi:MAG TPA: DUF4142 domain-containing protein [Phycisphaerae bacterium]|nr:DUF4142 domain-containing protein [Phycisphaerae bacterium]